MRNLIFTLFAMFILSQCVSSSSQQEVVYKVQSTNSYTPDSFDPIFADKWRNMANARMLFSTPIEVSVDDKLTSNVLSSFDYSPELKKLHWKLKDSVAYSDGTKITAIEVVLPLLRIALLHPDFPVVSDIVGIDKWRKLKHPLKSLPEGISIKDREIEIYFSRALAKPLYRLSLEIFSILPKKCIDLVANQLICDIPPSSGFYELVGAPKSLEEIKQWQYIRRDGFKTNRLIPPKRVDLLPGTLRDLNYYIENVDSNTVITTQATDLTDERIRLLRKNNFRVRRLPKTQYDYFVLNLNYPPFQDIQCRRMFADRIRESFEKVTGRKAVKGIFGPIIPGFLPNESFPTYAYSEEMCKSKFSKHTFKFNRSIKSAYYPIYRETFKSLGIEKTQNYHGTEPDDWYSFDKDNSYIALGESGFWPFDAYTDIQMFFSRGFMKTNRFLWEDATFTELRKKLKRATSDIRRTEVMKEINLHLYSESLIVPFDNFGFVMLVKNDSKLERIHNKVGSAAPWYAFYQEK